MDAMPVLLFVVIAALAIVGMVFAAIAARKRREAFGSLAARLGLAFSSDQDREIASRFKFLDRLAQGSNRYAYNILSGDYRGHRVMVQVQSSWFPLVDRNPQTFVNIPTAKAEDFKKATQRVYRSANAASSLTVQVLPTGAP